MTWALIFMLLVLAIPNVLCGQCKSSTHGKEFVFGILDMIDASCCRDSNNIIALDITNVSPVNIRIHLQIPYFNNNTYFNILRGQKKTIEIDPQIQRDGTFVDKRAIRISSDNDISVVVTNAFNSGAVIETYNILPVTALGNRYIISSFSSNYSDMGRGSVLLVAGVYDNTHVTLYNQTSTIYTTTVNSNDVFQYLCPYTCDLTGLTVISDKNTFVVSGSTFVYYPPDLYDCLGAAMIPTSSWSNRYIIPPVLPGGPFMIRVLSEHSLLNAIIANSSKTIFTNATHTENYFQNEPVVTVADQSFTVTQYGLSKSGSSFDVDEAFMAVVPGIDQYLTDYIFTVPKGYYNVTYYAAVIVPKAQKDGVLFDGISRQSYRYSITYLNVPAPLDDYIILTFHVDTGFHHFQQTFPTGNFGLFVYGLGIYNGYRLGNGFYAGFDLKGECFTTAATTDVTSTKTSLETTIVTSSRTVSTVYTTTASSSTNMAKPSNGRGQMCFVCADLSHIGLCDRVEQCNQNETCQIKEDKYSQSDAVCFECCHSNYCNNKGCGEDVPDRDSRGPICFDCEHVSSPEECFKVFPCNSDQVCRIEEYKWFGQSNFKMGCGQGVCDPVIGARSQGLKRATPVCQSCCTDDFCNRNCTGALAGQGGSVIVG